MARLTCASVTKAARAELDASLELVSHGDYFTWLFDDGTRYEERSVMTNRLNDVSLESWLFEARELLAVVASR